MANNIGRNRIYMGAEKFNCQQGKL